MQKKIYYHTINIPVDQHDTKTHRLEQGWANSGPRAKCGPPQRFKWHARKHSRKIFKSESSSNLSQQMLVVRLAQPWLAPISLRRYGPPLNAVFSKWPLSQS